ncbi:MAG: hypothetical protein LBE20_05275 [Deltaproteobacteria bacterium]|jgi:hypothetical protein|nr:hypothetical protein [Deltaproteobacteria bacterium]
MKKLINKVTPYQQTPSQRTPKMFQRKKNPDKVTPYQQTPKMFQRKKNPAPWEWDHGNGKLHGKLRSLYLNQGTPRKSFRGIQRK